MKVIAFCVVVASCFTCFGGETSVLNHGTTQQTAQPTAAEPTPADTAAATAETDCCCSRRRTRLYNVEESCSETCRNRLFGGYVKKNTSRTVYRPARR